MSTLKADTIVASDGTSPATLTKQSAAKQFASFEQTGTHTTYNSFNTSSLTDGGPGRTAFSLANNMSNATYASYGSVSSVGGGGGSAIIQNSSYNGGSLNSTSVARMVGLTGDGYSDQAYASHSILGDLA